MAVQIFTWNLDGKGSPEEVDKILTKFTSTFFKEPIPYVVCLQEANFPNAGVDTDNYRWLCKGALGSAILVPKASSLKIHTYKQVSEQICKAEITKENSDIKFWVISCLIPPSTEKITSDMWSLLTDIVKSIPYNVMFVIGGDFDAQIGKKDLTPGNKGLIGHGLFHDDTNENGIQLKKFASKVHVKIASTFGPKSTPDYTCKIGDMKRQCDYFLVPCSRECNTKVSPTHWQNDYNHAILGITLYIKPFANLCFFEADKSSEVNKEKLIVGSWNIQGGSPAAVDRALYELDMPVACVQEVFLTSLDDVKTDNYTWFTSKKLWGKNIGILIKTSSDIKLTNFELVSEFLCSGDITFKGETIKVISCFLPPDTDDKMQTVGKQLTDLIKSIPESDFYIVGGDFNCSYVEVKGKVQKETINPNGEFFNNLIHQFDLDLDKNRVKPPSISYASDSKRTNPHHILTSLSCRLKYTYKSSVRWIPLFENGIVFLNLSTKLKEEEIKPEEVVEREVKEKAIYIEKEESFNGNVYKSRRMTDIKVQRLKEAYEGSNLPIEEREKYQHSPPSPEALFKLLGGDFTLYYGFNEKSLLRSINSVLNDSFEPLNRGRLISDTIDVYKEETNELHQKIVRYWWNGIIVYEECGEKTIAYKKLQEKSISSFISVLGQKYCTVKAKKSYYNKGLAPMCKDESKLEKVMSVVKKRDFPEMKDVFNFIDDFFKEDSDLELVFGPDFTPRQFEEIQRHATEKDFGYRYYKASLKSKDVDHITVFIKHSPKYWRDKLLLKPDNQDLRFFCIIPAGDIPYFDHVRKWRLDHLKEDEKLMATHAKSEASKIIRPKNSAVNMRKRTRVREVSPNRRAKVARTISTRVSSATALANKRRNALRERLRSQRRSLVSRRESRRGDYGPYDDLDRRRNGPDRPRVRTYIPEPASRRRSPSWGRFDDKDRDMAPRSEMYRSSNYGPYDSLELMRNDIDPPRVRTYINDEAYNLYTPFDNMRTGINQMVAQMQAQSYIPEPDMNPFLHQRRSLSPPPMKRQRQISPPHQWHSSPPRQRAISPPRHRAISPRHRNSSPPPKRRRSPLRKEASRLPRTQLPRWSDLATLIIVWPVNIRSMLEDNPKKVLEANFPTEIELGPNNTVAVHVTLPLRWGRDKKYCLAVGNGVYKTARMALDIILKHSSVIKHTLTYLPPNGMTPNFVRYRVPCQSNPRTYVMLSKIETGYLTKENILEIFETFKTSYNEDIFFDRDTYTHEEKTLLLDLAPKNGLKVRHFGDDEKLVDRYVCVYKDKSKDIILEEVLKMGDFHPKYMLEVNRLPPQISLNIY